MERPLANVTVLVTRPRQRSSNLCTLIEQAGGTALPFAAIEITAPDDTSSRDYIKQNLAGFDLAIFISPTAVNETFDAVAEIPDIIKLAAIGSRTAAAIETRGHLADIVSAGHDSESLLQHEQLQAEFVGGKNIVIFRGVGGRELLGDTLKQRGARIYYAEMYQRSKPPSSKEFVQHLKQADIITVSSGQGLRNLYDLAPDKLALVQLPLVVPGERTDTLAKALGFHQVFIADNATDEACMNAIKYWATQMG